MDMFAIGDTVERMLAKADAVRKDVFTQFDISHVVAAFSGGDDSVVAAHWAMTQFADAVVMIGDTEIGLQKTRDHQQAVVKKFGWACERLSPQPEGPPKEWDNRGNHPWVDAETSYEEFVLNFGFPGNGQHHQMYRRLKQRAFRKIKPILGERKKGSRILVVSGVRQDESSIRAGYQRAFQEEKSECFVWMNPFYYCTAQDFEAYRQEYGLPRNPVKAQCGISGECCCGAHASEGEREAYRAVEPEFADYLDALEVRVMERFPWRWDQRPPKWFVDAKKGQGFLFDSHCEKPFMPACVGCSRKKLAN